jgi:GntR family transcriptional regulator
VREALRRIVEQGLIRTRQGAGSVVLSAIPAAKSFQSSATLEELLDDTRKTHFVVHAINPTRLEAETGDLIGGSAGEDWLLVSGVRWSEKGGKPLAYVELFVPAEFKAIVDTFWTVQPPFYAHLEASSGRVIVEVLQEIRAVEMPRAVSNAFGLPEASLSLQMTRRYVTREGTLASSVNWHRGDEFSYQTCLLRRIGV